MYSVGNVSSKESTWADQGRVRRNNGEPPGTPQVEMVPRQPDVEDEDSVTTEQRAALEKESDARQHYINCVLTNLVSKANKRAGKVGKILLVELVEGSGNSLLNYSTRSSNVVELIIFGIRATEWTGKRT